MMSSVGSHQMRRIAFSYVYFIPFLLMGTLAGL